jgi:HlyD family secretion protein
MKRGIYRQAALDWLSSPEQLDQVFQTIGPKHWVALVAVALLMVSAVSWGFAGSLAVTISGPGMVIRRGGISNIAAHASGLILSVRVGVGDELAPQQVIATLGNPELTEKLNTIQNSLAQELAKRDAALRHQRNSSLLKLEALNHRRADVERKLAALEQQAAALNGKITTPQRPLGSISETQRDHAAAPAKLGKIQDDISKLQAQLKQLEAEQFNIQLHSNDLDSESRLRIAGLQQELAAVEKKLQSEGAIVSPGAGRVNSLNVFPGAQVEAGQPVASFQPSGEKYEVLGYVPFTQARQIRKGMPVLISFAGTGHEGSSRIQGEVLAVSEFPSNSDELLRYLPVGFIKRYLNDPASVVEVRVMLKPAGSASYDSSAFSLDGEAAISAGRSCNIEIVARQQRPVALVIPYFKEKLGLN